MSISQVKEKAKKAMSTALLLGSLALVGKAGLAQPPNYQNPKPKAETTQMQKLPQRELILSLKNPLTDLEANSNLWYSANQLLGRANDYLGIRAGLDKNIFARLGLSFLAFWNGDIIRHYSHEIAHDQLLEKKGVNKGIHLDFTRWRDGFPWCPTYVQKVSMEDFLDFSNIEYFRHVANGFNQNELNTRTAWENNTLEGKLDMYKSAAYLMAKLDDLDYILGVGFKEERLYRRELNVVSFILNYHNTPLWNDVDQYIGLLYNNCVDLTKEEFFGQALATDILSWHTWESMISVGKYILKGERTSKPFTFKINKHIEITPPFINLYLTPDGSYFDMNLFVNPSKKHPIKFSFGMDSDFIRPNEKFIDYGKTEYPAGKVNHLRFGGQMYNITVPLTNLKLSPYGYLNTNRGFEYKGFSIGTELKVPVKDTFKIWGRAEYNKDDLIENLIKGEKNGFNLHIGLEIKI
ncbi:hypothetical protein KY341_05470 [Candidatus Woesearchaeota archaeon]|nr:hypothetical protein [Candidatus Woesearchaeota archaeon]